MDVLKINSFSDKYIEQIIDIHMKAFNIEPEYKNWTYINFLSQISDTKQGIYILVDQDKVIARADIVNNKLYSFDEDNTLYLFNFSRIYDDRYKGAGKLLLDFLIDHYSKSYNINENNNFEYYSNIKLLVQDDNQKLINYYKTFGFEEIKLPNDVYSILEKKKVKIADENKIRYGMKNATILRKKIDRNHK